VARNAFALALLTALALGGCSVFKGEKEAKAAEAKMIALRARTDSLRKARRLADSLAQVRYTACADSVRAEMSKPPVVVKSRKKKKKQPAAVPSEELILTQVQTVCNQGSSVPQPTVAAAHPVSAKAVTPDSAKSPVPAVKGPAAPATEPKAASPLAAGTTVPAQVDSMAMPQSPDAAYADSVRKAKEMELSRETFAYSGAARDPFSSLLNLAKNGPELADLQLVGIYQNLRAPAASVAVFREKDGGKRHKLRAGDQLGRSRLVQIRERDVVFTIEDFGFERQETLSLRKQEDVTP
jgi:hypothetical protein